MRLACVYVSDRVTLPLLSCGRNLIITTRIRLDLYLYSFFCFLIFFYHLSATTNSASKGPHRRLYNSSGSRSVRWCDFHSTDRTRITWEKNPNTIIGSASTMCVHAYRKWRQAPTVKAPRLVCHVKAKWMLRLCVYFNFSFTPLEVIELIRVFMYVLERDKLYRPHVTS